MPNNIYLLGMSLWLILAMTYALLDYLYATDYIVLTTQKKNKSTRNKRNGLKIALFCMSTYLVHWLLTVLSAMAIR